MFSLTRHSPRPPLNALCRRTCRQMGLYIAGSLWGIAGWAGFPALASFSPGQALAQASEPTESDVIRHPSIIIGPPVIWPYPQPIPQQDLVRVEFNAQGTNWGAVYLDGQLVYRPHNFNRQKTVHLRPGGYRLEVTGVVQSDLWASGYLDIGRDDSRLVVIRFSKANGVQVAGAPYVWIPDE